MTNRRRLIAKVRNVPFEFVVLLQLTASSAKQMASGSRGGRSQIRSHVLVSKISSLHLVRRFLLIVCDSSAHWLSRMLLGNALSLSHELDIFSDEDDASVDVPGSASELSFADFLRLRRHRVGKLLFVYISQLASRIGCSLPRTPFHDSVLSSFKTPKSKLDNEWHEYMTSWIELSRLIRTSSDFLFPSKKVTQELVRSGRYAAFLGHFRPLLSQWWDKFKRHASMAILFFKLFLSRDTVAYML